MAAKLRIINVTDVYKLDNFPHLRTLIDTKRDEFSGKTISILTGDFLAPYLLSSIDKGRGMIAMLNEVPIDYVIFGNHEDDLEHKEVCQRVADFKGTWINTNMRDYEAFKLQKDYEIVEISSKDGTNKKKIGFIGILSNSPGLYRKNPFGGATIDDPYETIALYKDKLENELKVDLTIPLCHLYVPQDIVTCERFDFPVILSGHDHHVVNEIINKTRLLKAGADAENAIILDLIWSSPDAPLQIEVKIEKVTDYKPNEALLHKVKSAYSVLDHLMHTQLTAIPEKFRPLSSVGSRSKPCTVASFLWSSLRDAFNLEDCSKEDCSVDCVLISGGDIRGGKDYPPNSYFSLEDLKSEVQEQLHMIIVEMDGATLSAGVKSTHACSNPGYVQFDDGVQLNEQGDVSVIGGKPIDPNRLYRFATTRWDITDGPSKSWVDYCKANPSCISLGDWPVYATLICYFARFVWKQIWKQIDRDSDGLISKEELSSVDSDGDGKLSRKEIAQLLRNIGFMVDDEELSFVDCIMDAAGDIDHDGFLTYEELNKLTAN